MYILDDIESSLIKSIEYDEDSEEITFYFRKYYTDKLTYVGVSQRSFYEIASGKHSFGKMYLTFFKPNFKLKSNTMPGNKPKGINRSSDQTRYIKINLDVSKINKDWLFIGTDGRVYMNATLAMRPDGDVDKYENLGFVVQDVPKQVFEKEKKLPKEKRTRGPILGNAAEFEYEREEPESGPGKETEKMGVKDDMDDIPF